MTTRAAALGWGRVLAGALLVLCASAPVWAVSPRFIWGRVVDAQSGLPIAGAMVQEVDGSRQAAADADGAVWLETEAKEWLVVAPGYRHVRWRQEGAVLRADPRRPRDSGHSLLASRVVWALQRQVQVRKAPLFSSHLALGWGPDAMSEQATGEDRTRFEGLGLRLGAARLSGGWRLGPILLGGRYDGSLYPIRRSDREGRMMRLQQEGEISALIGTTLGGRLAVGAGPSLLGRALGLTSAPPGTPDALDASRTQWGIGVAAQAEVAPWADGPLVGDIRLGAWPWTWELTSTVGQAQSLWSLQASAGVRWLVWSGWGIEGRYLFRIWQGAGYDQRAHGAVLGVVQTW